MAFIDTANGHPDWPTYYNVTSAVGYGCPNLVEDVKVVQFFLQRFFSLPSFVRSKPSGAMSVDGKAGPITRAWIKKCQIVCRQSHQNILVDGIINKAGNGTPAKNDTDQANELSTISHTAYTIHKLNAVLRHGDTAVYKTLGTNPIVPPDVRMIFVQIHAQGPPMNYGQA